MSKDLLSKHVLILLPLETISMTMLKMLETKNSLRKSEKTKLQTSLPLFQK